MSIDGLKNMISIFKEPGELGVISVTRGRCPVNSKRMQKIDVAIASTSSSSGASMLQQVSVRSVFGHYLFPCQLCINCCSTCFGFIRIKLICLKN